MPRKLKKRNDASNARVKAMPVPDSVSVAVGKIVTVTLGRQSALSLIALFGGDIDVMHFDDPNTRLRLCKRLDDDAELLGAIRATLAAGFHIQWCGGIWTSVRGKFEERHLLLGLDTPTNILAPFLIDATAQVTPTET